MSLPCRVTLTFVALVAAPMLWTMALSAPSLAETRVENGAPSDRPRGPIARHHHRRHVHRAAYIVCETVDVHSCHNDFARRHGVQAH